MITAELNAVCTILTESMFKHYGEKKSDLFFTFCTSYFLFLYEIELVRYSCNVYCVQVDP